MNYSFFFCISDINECASDPCQHGGDCSNLIDAFLCHCPLGYTGINCQIGTVIVICVSTLKRYLDRNKSSME